MSSWKRDFARGLAVLGPILVSLFAIYYLYDFLEGITPDGLVPDEVFLPVTADPTARRRLAEVVGVAVAIAFLLTALLVAGSFMRTTAGELLERLVDALANRVPGIRIVYNASKTASETAFGDERLAHSPVKLQTFDGHRMTAFKTGKVTDDGRELVFIPTSPNVTSGFVVEVDSSRLTELDESMESAITRVVSAGFGDAERVERVIQPGGGSDGKDGEDGETRAGGEHGDEDTCGVDPDTLVGRTDDD
ncbi:DUF502 domain-containing protein [Natrialbaceae archaeon GCM10025810]|uniref:DUF502 domain-containing protein n=1 Tax=Halovalidus salilacus TaxID=3075124 RepID=UPI00360C6063